MLVLAEISSLLGIEINCLSPRDADGDDKKIVEGKRVRFGIIRFRSKLALCVLQAVSES